MMENPLTMPILPVLLGLDLEAEAELSQAGVSDGASAQQPHRGAGAGATKKSGGPVKSRQARLKDNQTRYRERKKMAGQQLVAQYEATCAELERQQEQHERLNNQRALLETVLAVRDEWQGALTSQAKLQDSSPALESPLNSGDTSQLLQQLLAWRLAQGAGDAGTDRAACNGGGGAAVLSPPPLLSPPGPGLLPVAVGIQGATCPLAAVAEELVGALNEPHKSPGGLDPLAPLWGIQVSPAAVEQLRSCSWEQFEHSWRMYVGKTRDLLTALELTGSSAVLQELTQLGDQWALLIAVMLIYNPIHLQRLMSTSLGEPLSEVQWDTVVRDMGLQQSQHAECSALLDSFTERMQRLRQHAQQAVDRISQGSLVLGQGLEAPGLSNMMAGYLNTWDAALSLRVIPDMQFLAVLELFRLTSKDWSPLQRAKLVAAAAPNFPDVIQLISAMRRVHD